MFWVLRVYIISVVSENPLIQPRYKERNTNFNSARIRICGQFHVLHPRVLGTSSQQIELKGEEEGEGEEEGAEEDQEYT